ncbi:hypothetical protein CYMTET_35983 [Cymbomonas tetramitiformis]|uniref:Tr-type G domain-containing protein n=1 Tax=Cymbomonas tetramitiformis TaxID=36881 RepID=A0AAE0F849_9CHLO|nr:hypothetical protein CYMTET_35983 [Cymbomonas tetramitiformis]
MPRHASSYNYEDYDDGYDDDYGDGYDEGPSGYEDYDDYTPPARTQPAAAGRAASNKGKQPSVMAQFISQPQQAKKKKKGKSKGDIPAQDTAKPPARTVEAVKLQPSTSAGAGASTGAGVEATAIPPFTFDTPSPDDQVIAAQSGALPRADKRSAAAAPAFVPIQQKMKSLQVAAGPKQAEAGQSAAACPPRKPLEQYQADDALVALAAGQHDKASIHLVVVGHVDAGKSTLMGRLLHALGKVDQKAAHKNAKEAQAVGKPSFAWAFALDERPEERERGVTVDVALAHFDTPKYRVTLMDAPGHRDFVPSMITGTSQADVAVLVVDASVGEFEAGFAETQGTAGCGQTREHAQLVRSLGVDQLIVAVNKMDMVDYSQERFEEIRTIMAPWLKKLGFKEAGVQWVPVSGQLGENLWAAAEAPAFSQWAAATGLPHLVEAIDATHPPPRLTGMPLRLMATEGTKSFTLGQAAVGGKVVGGVLRAGTRVLVAPVMELATVKVVEMAGAAVAAAQAGDTVDVGLVGVDPLHLRAGTVLCDPEFPVAVASRFEVRIMTLDLRIPLLRGHQVMVHLHAESLPGRLVILKATLNPKTGEVLKERPRCVAARQAALAVVEIERPICCERFADYRMLGQVTLRDAGTTLAVGIITALEDV